MKRPVIIIIAFIFALAAGNAVAQDKQGQKTKSDKSVEDCSSGMSCCSTKDKVVSETKPWNEVCPVLGNKVSTSVKTVEYNGKAYGFCCPGCDDKFAKDPEQYSKNLSSDGKVYLKGKG